MSWSYPREWKALSVGDRVLIGDQPYVVKDKIRRPMDRELIFRRPDGMTIHCTEWYNRKVRWKKISHGD